MNVGEFHALFSRVTFHPDMTGTIDTLPGRSNGILQLSLEWIVRNKDNPSEPIPVMLSECISVMELDHYDEKEAMRFIENVHRQVWAHECDEWLRLDGELVRPQHEEKP